ncbi:MAG: hypothetical protein E7L17_08495 [Clostridium sp.]|uniref:hypothetical protein n=1 Tax=Clostridium sp. TaxID=1506 RepID=UPI00290F70B1|nr:hypothetical protein [Clostridium sp.]MDU7338138.1 hypothetical protein [Clostridium sp.]
MKEVLRSGAGNSASAGLCPSCRGGHLLSRKGESRQRPSKGRVSILSPWIPDESALKMTADGRNPFAFFFIIARRVGIFNGAPYRRLSFNSLGVFPKRNPKAEPLVSLSSFSSHQEKESPPRLEGRMKRKKKSPAAPAALKSPILNELLY